MILKIKNRQEITGKMSGKKGEKGSKRPNEAPGFEVTEGESLEFKGICCL